MTWVNQLLRQPNARVHDSKSTSYTGGKQSDVANAILDGTDAIMLSGETANGAYPVEAVTTVTVLLRVTEQSCYLR